MGTNYYYDENDDEFHIGKSSVGWKFHLSYDLFEEHRYWKRELIGKDIYDEYGEHIDCFKFFDLVEKGQDTVEAEPTEYEREMYQMFPRFMPVNINGYIFIKGDWS